MQQLRLTYVYKDDSLTPRVFYLTDKGVGFVREMSESSGTVYYSLELFKELKVGEFYNLVLNYYQSGTAVTHDLLVKYYGVTDLRIFASLIGNGDIHLTEESLVASIKKNTLSSQLDSVVYEPNP